MVKSWLVVVLLVGVSAASVAGLPAVVDYVEGDVVQRTPGGPWGPVHEGDEVAPDASLKINDGVVELVQGDLRWHLGRPGTYTVGPLTQGRPPRANSLDQVGAKLAHLLGFEIARTTTTSAGVRGAAAGGTDVPWVEPNAGSVKAFIAQEAWPQALATADEALADAPNDPELLVLKAQILAGQGRAAAALRTLDRVTLGPADPGYLEATLLYAAVALEAGEYALVIDKTNEALAGLTAPELRQGLILAQALAYEGLGDPAQARRHLEAVVAFGPSPAADEARRLLAP